METKTIITDITHEDLVNLLSTATYGSSWLGIKRPVGSYRGTELESEDDCLEDTWAKILLNGGKLYFCDYYAEDDEEFYGNKPHEWRQGRFMRYEVTLEDIKNGICKAIDLNGHPSLCARRLIDNDNLDFDMTDADCIVQIIMFDEVVYG